MTYKKEKDEAKKLAKMASEKQKRDAITLPALENDPRKMSSTLCHGYLCLDCKACLEALKMRLLEMEAK